ncbi:type VI secretion system amidase effector protein Tae4 [Ralstonia pseudosolanacearum]|uniref:type VI secretion system amidase effector protein Tae4 n=1 Tax=Ralstonia pseudosolanacearum TaxID=1310165 RepID=UPI001CB8B16E|nr:type VI secretion system amidase effector protein Tae4 [Ralstonia pseudosolanacearum]
MRFRKPLLHVRLPLRKRTLLASQWTGLLGAGHPWRNTCAVRMSYILNQAGVPVPNIPGKTKKGGDHHNDFYRIRDVIAFLKSHWGAPEVVAYPPAGGGNLAGKTGVILFEVQGWSDAAGHATLFNGRTCYDHCYFNEPGVTYRTNKANFWALK